MLFLVVGIIATVFAVVVVKADRKLRDDLVEQANHFARAIDKDLVVAIVRNPADEHLPEYQELKQLLEFSIQLNTHIRYVYLVGQQEDGSLFFLMDTGQPSDRGIEAHPGELYEDAPDEMFLLYDLLESAVIGPYSDRWGTFVTALTPLTDPDNNELVAVMGIDVDSSDRFSNISTAVVPLALVMIVFLLLFVVVLVLLIQQLKKSLAQQRLVSNELQQSEEIVRRLLQAVPDLIVKTDMAGTITFVNEQSFSILANQVGKEVLGKNVFSFVAEEDLPRAMENAKLRLDLESGVHEYRLVFADVVIDAEVNGAAICDHESRPLGMVYVIRDISERKKAEEALKQSESRFRTLLKEVKSVAVQGYRPDGTIIYWNKASEDFYGYTDQEALGQNLIDLIIPEEMQEQVRQAFREMKDSTDPHPSGEIRLRHKDGRILEMFTSHALYQGSDGVVELYSFDIDLSERKKAEESLRKIQARLFQTQKIESIGLLAGGIAHDFNNMLGVILGRTEMALNKTDANSPLRKTLVEVQKAARRSADLTGQLLAFARKQTIAPKVLDLNATLEGMMDMLIRLVGNNVSLIWRPGDHLWNVRMDPSQIDQILINLCVNARDAIFDTGTVSIETSNVALDKDYCEGLPDVIPGEYMMLTVSDDGSGMDEQTLSHLFEPFYTTKKMGLGTGLGLATVDGVVRQNKGFIQVSSAPDKGTIFQIYLPRYDGEQAPQSSGREEAVLPRGSETILLVEDEPMILDLAESILKELGYRVLVTSLPSEAVQRAENSSEGIDLLLTDVVMPEMNGRVLAGKLGELNPTLKVLYMSGYTANVIAHHGVLDEGISFIQKPFTQVTLATKVRDILDS